MVSEINMNQNMSRESGSKEGGNIPSAKTVLEQLETKVEGLRRDIQNLQTKLGLNKLRGVLAGLVVWTTVSMLFVTMLIGAGLILPALYASPIPLIILIVLTVSSGPAVWVIGQS